MVDKHLNILILEDSSDDVDLIEYELKKAGIAFTSRVVNKRDEFEQGLKEFHPDVILSDHAMPKFNSIEALNIYKAYEEETNVPVPFILVTGAVSEEFAVQCIKAGANDYILKDRLKRLPSSIQSALEKTRIEGERRKFFAEMQTREAMMKAAENLAGFGSWQVNIQTGKHQWSDEAYRIYGYEPGEIEPSYEKFISHVHPEDVDALRNALDNAMANLDSYECEIRIIDKNGKVKYLDTKVLIKRDSNHKPVWLAGFNLDITDKKKADILLRKREQEYKSLFDRNPDAVYSLDLEGKFTNVNDALVELAGSSREALLQMDFRPFLTAEDGERVLHSFYEATQGNPQQYEAKFINAKGRSLTLSITNMPVVVNQEIIGVHGIIQDVTEKRALEVLLDKVDRLARIGGWEADFELKKIKWTSVARELHEVAPDFDPDFEKGIQFYKQGESHETIKQALQQAIENGTPWDLELPIITAKGNERWIRTIGEAEFRNRKCIRLYGSFQDIHERKRAEESLKELYEEKNTILESIGDAFFMVDKNWIVTYWNKSAETKLGMPREKIIGKNLWEVYKDAIPLAFYSQYHKAMDEQVIVHFHEHYPPLNLWVEATAYPSPAGLSVYLTDVTEIRKYAAAVEDQNARLREIAWTQSHQVRAPLARLMGLANILQNHKVGDEEQAALLNHISNAANELDTIIRRIVRKTEEIEGD